MINYIVGGIVIGLMIFATIRLIKNRHKNPCGGGCASCEGCPYSGQQ